MSTCSFQAGGASFENASARTDPRRAWRRRIEPCLWLAPLMVLLVLVILLPTAVVLWLSFQTTQYFKPVSFAGFANYAAVLGSGNFRQLTSNSLIYVFGSLALVLPSGLVIAVLLKAAGRLGAILRPLLLVPWTLSMAVVGSLWLFLLNPSFGPASYLMREFGISLGLMLGDPRFALALLIVTTAWWSIPYAMVMSTAALQGIPRELYEAVAIDGGGAITQFRHVTLPQVMPTLASIGLTLAILYLTLITLIIVLTGGGPLGATSTWSFEVFRSSFQDINVAPAAVLSIVVLCANLVLGLVYQRISRRPR
ncbi:MAG TPA: sugar ABC transporter permease [Ramlibacter sp.]|uniref:carbohydrate ABC transporter permease n=1 Tax=Ramlibacter sp. TaxID=1917967 RepID=UPI002C001C21|nr:sugar ABC transporter permease [Ramlibacter sp.]HVZ43539.1 sugar ABC transporter permease [Ramlibacter sp.]